MLASSTKKNIGLARKSRPSLGMNEWSLDGRTSAHVYMELHSQCAALDDGTIY